MQFYVNRNYRQRPNIANFPACILNADNWDDYNTKSKFHLKFCPDQVTTIEIGVIKILKRGESTTIRYNDAGEIECILP